MYAIRSYYDLKASQQRVSKAQQIGRLGHWELDMKTGRFHLCAQDPAQFGVEDPHRYESMFAQIELTESYNFV